MRPPAREFALPTERDQPYAVGSASVIGSGHAAGGNAAGHPDGISGYDAQARQTSAAVDAAEVPMSAMPIASCTVAAVLLAIGGAVAPSPAPAAARTTSSTRSSAVHPGRPSAGAPPSRSRSSTPPGPYPNYPQYGRSEPYYCYAYPANCARPMPYPFHSYPPSYYLSPSYGYARPHGGGPGFGIAVAPVFGFWPGIVILHRRFAIHRRVHVHR
jgi:hypothetical protein